MNNIRYGRKRSGIKKDLVEKMNDWISSIDDKKVRQLAKRDAIVTGGSIASMLLGEKANDYDVYFKTKEATVAVAKYYMDKHFETDTQVCEYEHKEDEDGNHVKDNGEHLEELSILCYSKENIKGEQEERVECYIKSTGFSKEKTKGKKKKGKYRVYFISSNAITLTNKIQIIIRFFGEPSQIHNNYDFEHAKSYFEMDGEKLVISPSAMECLLSRTLIYRGSLYPIASIFRMKKFIERGWRISAGQQFKIMWQISQLDLRNKMILKDQLTGVDMAYLDSLVSAITASVEIEDHAVMTIVDRIFSEAEPEHNQLSD